MNGRQKDRHSGSCLCGAVVFSFTGKLDDVWFCHCTQCRKNYGMYGAFVGVPRKSFKINKAKVTSYRSSADTKRTFCYKCGSPITWDRKGHEGIYVLVGLIEGKVKVMSAKHIFTKDKGAYYEICDQWPKYKTVPK
ncbi:MAG: hypothetical protein RL141_1110 [Candidatus Parcubacteria bacterium]